MTQRISVKTFQTQSLLLVTTVNNGDYDSSVHLTKSLSSGLSTDEGSLVGIVLANSVH